MSIRFRCPECDAEIKVSDRHAGQKGRCATCNAKILVPTLEQAAELKAKEAKKKAAPPAPPPATPSTKSPPRPTPIAPTEPEVVTRPRPEGVPGRLVEKPKEPIRQEEEDFAVPAGGQPSLPDDFFDDDPVEVPEIALPVAATVPPAVESPAKEEVAAPQSEYEDEAREYEDEEEADEDRELVATPSAALSTGEGNDILSAMSLDSRDLIHLEGDEHDDHAPMIRKSVGLEGVEELVDMTAMVDIVFFLLIFFMMTTMTNVSASIETPTPDPDKLASQGRASASMDDDSNAVKIRIEADNSLQFEGERIGGEQELKTRLAAAFPGGGSSKKLFVMGHGDAYHGTVVMVLDAAHSSGIQDIRLAVVDDDEQ